MALTFRSQGVPLSFAQLDANFSTLQKNARVWDSLIQYEINDIVFYDGGFYEATVQPSIGTLPTDTNYWNLLLISATAVDLSAYLTISEGDSRFVNTSGDTINGSLVINNTVSASNLTGTNTGDERYTNPTPTPTTIGGIIEGMTFNNLTIQQMLDYILYPELFPTLTNPSNTFTISSLDPYYEVGFQINTLTMMATFNRGLINPAYTTSGFRSGPPTQYNYTGYGLNNVPTNALNDIQTITNYIIIPGSQSWSGNVTYSQGEQPLSSKGNPYDSPLPAGTTGTLVRTTIGLYPFLYGMSEFELDGTTLYTTFNSTKLIQTEGNKTVGLDGNLKYIYFAYPATYADLISIIDQNGFIVTGSFTKILLNVTSSGLASNYTTLYKVYRTIDKTTVLNNSFQFKFN